VDAPRLGRSLTPHSSHHLTTRQERFELPTFGSVDRRSIQLSYWRRAA
jgi:hypothetical protein